MLNKILMYVDVDIGSIDENTSIRNRNNDTEQIAEYMNDFLATYKNFIIGIYGVAAMTLFLVLLIQFARLSQLGKNPMTRNRAISELMFSILAIAFLGGIGTIGSLIINLFN